MTAITRAEICAGLASSSAGPGTISVGEVAAILSEATRKPTTFEEIRVSPSSAEFIRQIKSQIAQVDPGEVHEGLAANGNGTSPIALIDIRENEEIARGLIPGSKHVPRSYLETRIEGAVPDRSQRVVLYCASGNRSVLAAKTLEDLGYEHVSSMTGGYTLWKDRGYKVEVPRTMTAEQRERYSRHMLVPEIGLKGQQKMLDAKVLLLGAGGLGSPTALYLAAAGIGTIGIVDDDVVDLSNLQRQVIHTTDRIGTPKVDSAQEQMNAINPDIDVVKYQTRLDASNIMEIIEGYDVIVDGVDNFPTRYLLNDATVRLKIPVVSASILGFDGQLSVFAPYEGPCYRCLYPVPPPAELAPSCGANGVLGVLPGTMGLLQATEVIKLVTGAGEPLIGRLLLYEALGATFTELKVRRDPECEICSREPDEIADDEMGVFPDYEAFCAAAG
jgi:molybdopterin/thiamine biosynthesis adenylyltransferase/rhodanese-related sulfurtransferase